MDIEAVARAIALYFQTFDATKALQIAYYVIALIVASMGLWKAIRYAEGKMPKRLLEFVSRFEGKIVEKKLKALERIRLTPNVPESAEYLDVNAEVDRAIRYLDKDDPENAAAELERLAVRLEEKITLAEKQLMLTKQQTSAVQLLFGTLARKVPQRRHQSESALKRAVELAPKDPEPHKEIGNLKLEAKDYRGAREFFTDYWNAATELSKEKRGDVEVLLIDACRLTATCHRYEESPDLEKRDLLEALKIAEAIADQGLKPHVLKAQVLEELGDNAANRRFPQRNNIEEYYDKGAAEFRLAGLVDDAERVLRKKKDMNLAA